MHLTLRKAVFTALLFLPIAALPHGKTDDFSQLQGTWAFVSGQQDGQPAVLEKAKSIRVVFRGNRIQIGAAHMSEPEQSFVLIPNTLPKAIDFTPDAKGIYELRGNTLKLRIMKYGGPRPKDFTGSTVEGESLLVLKRE